MTHAPGIDSHKRSRPQCFAQSVGLELLECIQKCEIYSSERKIALTFRSLTSILQNLPLLQNFGTDSDTYNNNDDNK